MKHNNKGRVLLISPNMKGVKDGSNRVMPKFGLGCIAAVLRDCGYEVFVRDTALEGYDTRSVQRDGVTVLIGETDDQIANFVRELSPDIVGITVPFTMQSEPAKSAAKIVKSVNRDIPVIVGGHHVTGIVSDYLYAKSKSMTDSHYEKVLYSFLDDRNIDYAMIGEGDYEFPNLVDCLLNKKDVNQIKNLIFFDNHSQLKITTSPNAQCFNIQDPSQGVPRPAWEFFNMKKYFELGTSLSLRTTAKRVYPLMTTRGCPEKCSFCAAQNTFGRKVRCRNPEDIALEIREAVQTYGEIEELQFLDDSITAHLENLYNLCDELEAIGIRWCTPVGTKANYHMSKQPDYYRRMKESGCYQITIACETGNQDIMDNVLCKNLKLEEIAKSVQNAKNAGLYVHTFWIVGFPYQTRESMEETIAFAASTGADSYTFSIFMPLPGTVLGRTVIHNNLFWPETENLENMYFASSLIKADGFDGPNDFICWVNKQNILLNDLLRKKDPTRYAAYEALKDLKDYGKYGLHI